MAKRKAPVRPKPAPSARPTTHADILGHDGILAKIAMEKTWALAAIIIVPIVIGLILDKIFYTFPGLFIAGILAAALGVTRLVQKSIK